MENFSIKKYVAAKMMEKFVPLTDNQIRVINDSALVYESYLNALRELQKHPGWMFFKPKAGREYLFHALDRKGNGKSMGRRSPETEELMDNFRVAKESAEERFQQSAKRAHEQARFCKAARVPRVPTLAGKIIRSLERAQVGDNFLVVGTNALYAYEVAAGIMFLPEVTATADMDILWDSRKKLAFAISGTGEHEQKVSTFMDLLREVDRLFTVNTERTFQALNGTGFAVELLKPVEPVHPFKAGEGDMLTPMPLRGQDWLLLRPPLKQIAIGQDGYALLMRAPDPRLFCLHKAWLSTLDDRNADKKQRDLNQARLIASILADRLPQYPMDELLAADDIPDDLKAMADMLDFTPPDDNTTPYF